MKSHVIAQYLQLLDLKSALSDLKGNMAAMYRIKGHATASQPSPALKICEGKSQGARTLGPGVMGKERRCKE